MITKKCKFLFVYLKTGGGHLAPAKSIANNISKKTNSDVVLFDGLEKSWWLARFVVVDGYRILQNKAKWIYELIYLFNKLNFFANLSAFLVTINTEKYLEEKILREMPDKIVVFHFLLIKSVYNVLKKHNLDIKVITLVTDPYTAHPLWFLNKKQNFIIFSERLKTKLIKDGIEENRINVFPFVLDEKFSSKINTIEAASIKNRLGFKKEKTVLILGGGDGIPKGIRILKNLLKSSRDFEIAFVCGKNKRMFNRALEIKNKNNFENLKIYGYIDFVYDLLNISDVVITKCGASTFMEILMTGKVPIVNNYIWEQEKGNVDFIVENEMGIFEKRVSKLSEIVCELFSDESLLNNYKSNIEKANLKNGTDEVSEFILTGNSGIT